MRDWHIANARDMQWFDAGQFGFYSDFQKGSRFEEFGFNIGMALPGQPGALYHRESHQEGFLVLSGEALLIVEGEERPLRAWDYFHCPAGVEHIIVGAGDGPCVLIGVGGRVGPGNLVYPVNHVALKHGAGVKEEPATPRDAYAQFPESEPKPVPFREEFLP
jgi:uncharacterized cupin superfamily protein